MRLGPPRSDGSDFAAEVYSLDRFRLRGDLVGFALTRLAARGSNQPGEYSDRIVLRRVRRGARAVEYDAQDRRGPYDHAVKRPGVSDLVADRRGRAAWITRNPYGNPTQIEVYKHDSGGRVLLDQGQGIDRASLRLADGTLSWRHDGAVRTAPFG